MNEADLLILTVIGISAIFGAIRGALTEVLSLLLWLLALVATIAMGDAMGDWLRGYLGLRAVDGVFLLESPWISGIIGHILVFLLVMLIGNLLIWLARKFLHGAGLALGDRLLGAAFGVLRGAAVVVVAVVLVGFTPWTQSAFWQASVLAPAFEDSARWLKEQVPAWAELFAPAPDALAAVAAPMELG